MDSVFVRFEDLRKDDSYYGTVISLLNDSVTDLKFVEDYLKTVDLFELYNKDDYLGFYSKEDHGTVVELHLYIKPSCRNHSIEAMRYLFSTEQKNIKTSVYGTHLHVVTFLKRLGFVVTSISRKDFSKEGVFYDFYELEYKKENING